MTTNPNPGNAYFLLKQDHALKLGPRSTGGITYVVLADAAREQIYLQVTGNDGGGYWSREIVMLSAVENCLPTDRDEAFPAKRLANAFTGRSSNNGGFLAAVLHHEGLLAFADGKEQRAAQVRASDWSAWSAAMLAMTGEPYVPEGQKAEPELLTVIAEAHPGASTDAPDRRRKSKRKAGKPKGEVDAEISAVMESEAPESEHADLA